MKKYIVEYQSSLFDRNLREIKYWRYIEVTKQVKDLGMTVVSSRYKMIKFLTYSIRLQQRSASCKYIFAFFMKILIKNIQNQLPWYKRFTHDMVLKCEISFAIKIQNNGKTF